jgi:hypothetical protein
VDNLVRQTLRLHPSSICSAVKRIEVDVGHRLAHSLALTYIVTGKISDLAMPPAAAAARTEELWRHSCFEAFVRGWPDVAYYEINFAPSTQWAAYKFSGYRSGMRVAAEINAPQIVVKATPDRYILRASLELAEPLQPAAGGRGAIWRLGLSAVIEETGGRQSYWALAHPPGRPDFHHSDCFALEVPTA